MEVELRRGGSGAGGVEIWNRVADCSAHSIPICCGPSGPAGIRPVAGGDAASRHGGEICVGGFAGHVAANPMADCWFIPRNV